MPIMILNGNVMPNADAIEIDVFACGTAIRNAAGAAIYEALADNVAKITVPPKEKPTSFPIIAPITEATKGNKIPKAIKNIPFFLRSSILLEAIIPISSKKNNNTLLKGVIKKDLMGSINLDSVAYPIKKPPIKR